MTQLKRISQAESLPELQELVRQHYGVCRQEYDIWKQAFKRLQYEHRAKKEKGTTASTVTPGTSNSPTKGIYSNANSYKS